jgi:hypothetical protein
MHRKSPQRKGPVVKLERIDRLVARVRRQNEALDSAPHSHGENTPQSVKIVREKITGRRWPVAQSILQGGCPSDCPLQARRVMLSKRLMRLGKIQRAVLEQLARARVRARRAGSIVTREMYEQASARASRSKQPRKELARQLGMSRQGLLDWEAKHLRKR